MVVSDGIWVYNSAVNSGNPMFITGKYDYSGVKNVKYSPILDNKTDSSNYKIAEVERGGIENPIIIVNGSYDVDDVGTNWITEKLIKDLYRNRDQTTRLTIKVGSNTVITNYKGVTPTDITTDGIKVELKTFSIKPPKDAVKDHIITYTLTFAESE